MLEKLSVIISEQMDIDISKISNEVRLDEIGIESVELIELIFFIESEFEVTIPDEALGSVTKIGDFVSLLNKLLETV